MRHFGENFHWLQSSVNSVTALKDKHYSDIVSLTLANGGIFPLRWAFIYFLFVVVSYARNYKIFKIYF